MEKVMMKSAMAIGMIMVALLANNSVRAEGCGIVNPSFEDDGRIDDITMQEPNGWSVDVAEGKFSAFTYTIWPTDGFFNLSVYTNNVQFYGDDKAMVSQEVDLTAVSEITFDVKLETKTGPWDPSVCAAVLMVDDDVVWEPNSLEADVRGEYRNQVYAVEDKYRDGQPHTLALGLRMNTDIRLWVKSLYQCEWDIVDCTLYCNGGGLLGGDFDRDCFVDMNDLMLVADAWLDDVDPYDRLNPFRADNLAGSGGTVNFRDFAVYADGWTGDAADLGMFTEQWLNEVALDEKYNLFKDDDVNPSGIVNFFDLAILADNWLGSSYIEDEEDVTPDGNGN
jgi:hypothetical protein